MTRVFRCLLICSTFVASFLVAQSSPTANGRLILAPALLAFGVYQIHLLRGDPR